MVRVQKRKGQNTNESLGRREGLRAGSHGGDRGRSASVLSFTSGLCSLSRSITHADVAELLHGTGGTDSGSCPWKARALEEAVAMRGREE